MKNKYLLGYIYSLTFLTIAINVFYAYELFSEFIKIDIQNQYKEMYISAIALELSWVVILTWFLAEPFKRKEIVLITTVPMIIANILHNYTLGMVEFVINLLFLILFVSLYFVGYYLLNHFSKRTL